MELDLVLESESYYWVREKSKTVHASYQHSPKAEEVIAKGKPRRDYQLRGLDCDFSELSISNSPRPYHKNVPSKPVGLRGRDNEVLKRGSVYQSSREVRQLKKLREGSRIIESPHGGENFLSFDLVDSSSRHCEKEACQTTQDKRLPLTSLNAGLNSKSLDDSHMAQTNSSDFQDPSFHRLPEEHSSVNSANFASVMARDGSSDSFLDFCLLSKDIGGHCTKAAGKTLVKEQNLKGNGIISPEKDGNVLAERDTIHYLPKSFSEKIGMLNSPCQSENDQFKFSPKHTLRKIMVPFMKSKSQRCPSVSETDVGSLTTINPASTRRNQTVRKSLLNDFLKATKKIQKMEYNAQLIERNQRSPAHLQGILKLKCEHGVPSFEFSIKDLGDVLSARTWKTDNAFNWIYTFHSKKKQNSNSGLGSKDRHMQELPMVGQLQVSCYLYSEVNSYGSMDESTVIESVLYDISQARKSLASEARSQCSAEAVQPSNSIFAESSVSGTSMESNCTIEADKCIKQPRGGVSNCNSDTSAPYPWATDVLPHHEIAAIVCQFPFRKKESLKDGSSSEVKSNDHAYLSCESGLDQAKATIFNSLCPVNLKVVTPRGRHGLPSREEGGPSPLLDRWRAGGGCDCGGWDMACPLLVLDNSSCQNAADYSSRRSPLSLELFTQGAKDKIPSLTITADEGGYLVDFHAQLSTLQAFSISVAILHNLDIFMVTGREINRQMLRCSSLKLLLEEEVRHLIEALGREENMKAKKIIEHIRAPHLLHPPFSPMGRV